MNKKLVLAGGGHAHMVTLANLHAFVEKGVAVTVVQPSEYHYYSGMGPGMLGGTYSPDDIRFATRHVVEKQGGAFVKDRVLRVDPSEKTLYLASGAPLKYDVVSFNVGSHIPENLVRHGSADLFLVKPIEKLMEARNRIIALAAQKATTVGVVGGGPSAVEISGNIWGLARKHCANPVTVKIFSGRRLISRAPEKVGRRAEKSLSKRGIQIFPNSYIQEIDNTRIVLKDGRSEALDIVFLAVGVNPSDIFKKSGLPTGPDGGLMVNPYLQCTQYPDIFGGGDCIYFENRPLDKVGVYAVRQNPVLYNNLMARLEGKELAAFSPGGDYLLIYNLGDGTGIFYKWSFMFGGRLAFFIKDAIDRKFMKKFQSIESA